MTRAIFTVNDFSIFVKLRNDKKLITISIRGAFIQSDANFICSGSDGVNLKVKQKESSVLLAFNLEELQTLA